MVIDKRMKHIIIIICCLFPYLLLADNVTVEQAKSLAVDFFRASAQTRSASPQIRLVWDGEETSTRTTGEPAFYVFAPTNEQGFVIVSGEDVTLPVLGYSFENEFKAENMPVNLRGWLAELRRQINDIRKKNPTVPATNTQFWKNASASIGTVEKQLTTAKWNQDNPYNKYCPFINSRRAVTGCVATALAIVMRYHQWPDKGIGTLPDYSYEYGNVKRTQKGHSLGHIYNWANMPLTSYKNSYWTLQQQNAVAQLIYDCGVMAQSEYTLESTGAISRDAVQGLITYMKYGKGAKFLKREWYSDVEWIRMLKQEIVTNGPVLYGGRSSEDGGHQFVLDGYTNRNYFSVNWGWGGSCDGYYLISILNPTMPGIGGSYGDYNYDQDAVFGLKKEDGNSQYENILVLIAGISTSGTPFYGLTTTETDIQSGKLFEVSVGFCHNLGFKVFNGEGILSLVDRNGVWKEDISPIFPFDNLEVYRGQGWSRVPCSITEPLASGDRIWLRYRGTGSDSSSDWQRMLAGEGTVSEIIVKEPGLDEVTSLFYSKKDKLIFFKTMPDVAYKLTLGTTLKLSGKTTVSNQDIRIDTRVLTAGTYKLTLEKGDNKKELNFVIGNQK